MEIMPRANESFPEAPRGSLIQGNHMPFNSLETARTELEHFMDRSQMKRSASVWYPQLPSKGRASAFTMRMHQEQKPEAA